LHRKSPDFHGFRRKGKVVARRMEMPLDRNGKKRSQQEEGLSNFARAMREAEPYLQAGWSLAGAVALGTVVGYLADRKLGTTPWLLIVGSCLGLAAGFYAFIKAVLQAERKKAGR
jgi:ATP synthase protein I